MKVINHPCYKSRERFKGMIFSNCECDEPITVGWESGMERGYYRVNCEKCGRIAMVECTSLGGQTHILKNEQELDEFVKEMKLNVPN